MSSAVVMLQGGPAHGSYYTIPSPFPAELKVPMPEDIPPSVWDPNQEVFPDMPRYRVAVYRKGHVHPPVPPMRAHTSVYVFAHYEGSEVNV